MDLVTTGTKRATHLTKFFAGRYRWCIVGLLFCLSTTNYLHRQSLSVLVPTVRKDLQFGVEQYSYTVAAFLIAYTLGYLLCGRILDRFGAKRGIACAVGLWSTAAMLHSTARSWRHLAVFRFVLGLGESFNFPGGAKVIREWIPKRERALSMAVFTTGNVVGAIVAPPLVSFLALRLSWRFAFLTTGAVGLVWLLLWWRLYRPPEAIEDAPPAHENIGFWAILRNPLTLAFLAARFLTDPLPYFFTFWMPEYLSRAHNFGLAEIGRLAWIPWLAADLGGLSGGAASDWLTRRGMEPTDARRRILGLAACMTPAAIIAVHAPTPALALAGMAIVLAGQSAWMANILTLMTEALPAGISAQVVAFSSIGGSISGIMASVATGQVIVKYGYVPIFTALGAVHMTAFLVLTLAWRTTKGKRKCVYP